MEYVATVPRTLKVFRDGDVAVAPQGNKSLAKYNYRLRRVADASRQLIRLRDLTEIAQVLVSTTVDILDLAHVVFWLQDDANPTAFHCYAASSQHIFSALQQFDTELENGIIKQVAQTRKYKQFTKANSDFLVRRERLQEFQFASVIAIPLHIADEVVAVLEILSPHAHIAPEGLESINTVAEIAGSALENVRLIAGLHGKAAKLETRNEELEAFAHTVAHDLRTPLNWVNGYIELLIKDWDILEEGERVEYAHATHHGAQMMSNIIDELLLLASLHDAEVVCSAIDMDVVLGNARVRLEPMIRQYKAELVIPNGYPKVSGYAPWIEGVWVNYISNAIKYGGSPAMIQTGYTVEGEFVQFWVEDNGKGLTKEQRDQLFIPFGGLHKGQARGNGLGLSIVRRIVEKLGGKVTVESEIGQGSRFIFSLPIVPNKVTTKLL